MTGRDHGFIVLVIGALLTAAGVMGFVGASDALEEAQQFRSSLGGLPGIVIDLADAMGATDLEELQDRLEFIRLAGIGVAIFGGFVALFGLLKGLK